MKVRKCHKLANSYRTAVYSAKTVADKMVAVKAVLYHNLDHPDATAVQRAEYHQYRKSTYCEFRQWVDDNNDPNLYIRQKLHKDLDGSSSKWTGGYLKELYTNYSDAFAKLKIIFGTLGSEELRKRCTKKLTQNINESVHSKLWRIVLKFKCHNAQRYQFACQMVMMIHNFGHVKASLLNVLDCMTYASVSFFYHIQIQRVLEHLREITLW